MRAPVMVRSIRVSTWGAPMRVSKSSGRTVASAPESMRAETVTAAVEVGMGYVRHGRRWCIGEVVVVGVHRQIHSIGPCRYYAARRNDGM